METDPQARKTKFRRIVLAYPVALIAIAIFLNVVAFGIDPMVIALPERSILTSLIIAAVVLLATHTWIMTSTELTRIRFDMHATPEEWSASGRSRDEVTLEGNQELERHHNAHTNLTENTVHFALLAAVISVTSPTVLAAQVWIVGFALGRLGHALSYLGGKDGLRGIFMSASLVSLYGLASYLVLSLFT